MDSSPATNTLLDAAMTYAARGWPIFPCHTPVGEGCSCRNPECTDIGKHPRTTHGLNDATTDPVIIQQWWKRWPVANVAIATGSKAGLVVLDEDSYKGGDISRRELEQTYSPLPDTIQQLTGGGGIQFFFAHPVTHVKNSVKELGEGLDVRGDGGYVIAPPSLHASGKQYVWELSHEPEDTPLAPFPAWLLALCQASGTRRNANRVDVGASIMDGARNTTLFRTGSGLRGRGFSEAVILASLLEMNQTQCQPPLPDADIRAIAASCAQYTPGANGTTGPRDVPIFTETSSQETSTDAHVSLGWNDYTNALAFVRDHGQNVRYCFPWGKWLQWQGTHWAVDQEGAVMRLAKETIKRLAGRAEHMDDDDAKLLMKHVKASLSTAKLKAMVESAQSELPVPILPETLDSKPWLLNCQNGTLDLTSGKLQPACREDYLTSCLRTSYAPEQDCPLWKHFLWQICDGPQNAARAQALTTFLQHMVGYSLTGTVREQCLFILWGSGANGKSTFSNTLMALLHSYAMKASTELLMVSGQDRHPTERTDLFGKRLVTAIETAEGGRLNEVFVKEATGGDPIRARRMREDFWEFLPTHKILLATNHKPTIRGTDHAIWRRIRLVPFTVTIPDTMQDDTLPEKLLTELPGILRWAVEGCLGWQRDGLGNPDVIQEATAGYRQEMDVLGVFLAEHCILAPYASGKASALYGAYKQWCEQTGEYTVSQRNFGMRLSERGLERYANNGIWWRGIGLQETSRNGRNDTEPNSPINTSVYVHDGVNREKGSVHSVHSVDAPSSGETFVFPAFSRQSPCPKCKKMAWSPDDGNRPVCMQCGYLMEVPPC